MDILYLVIYIYTYIFFFRYAYNEPVVIRGASDNKVNLNCLDLKQIHMLITYMYSFCVVDSSCLDI